MNGPSLAMMLLDAIEKDVEEGRIFRVRGVEYRAVPVKRIKTLASCREVPSYVPPQNQVEWAKREIAMEVAAELIAKVFEFAKVRRLDYDDGHTTYFVDLDVIVPKTQPTRVMRSRYFTPEDPT